MATSPCYECRRAVPRDQMVRQRVLKGHAGRRKNGYLLMCSDCASKTQDSNVVVAVISLIAMAVIAGVVIAVRGH